MPTSPHDPHLRTTIALVVTIAWTVSFVADILIPEYDPPGSVGTLMLLVAGALFGEGVVRGVKNGNDKKNGKK